ncbi:MAG: nucleotidyltransferase domain-containing protein [Bacteroidota bacterium]
MHSITKENRVAISEVCERNHVASLHFFGSILDHSRFNEDSDIDILVAFKETLSLEDYTDCYFNLIFDLEDLLGRNIDITTERSLSNPYFIAELERTKVLFYQAQPLLSSHG